SNWCVTQDVTFEYNKIINSPGGCNLAAYQAESGGSAIPMRRVTIRHNVLEDVGLTTQPGDQRLFQMLGNLSDMTIANNTGFGQNIIVMFDGAAGTRLTFRDNILTRGKYGIFGGGEGEGESALSTWTRDARRAGRGPRAAPPTR